MRNVSVLIVDDSENLARTMSLILTRKGCSVVTAKNAPQSIRQLRQKPFDILFMDIRLHRTSGSEAWRQIKDIRPETVVVMMTACASDRLVEQAQREGAAGVIEKPLDIDRIVNLVDEAGRSRRTEYSLVIDDDPSVRLVLKTVLSTKGYEVRVASTGMAGIAAAREADYDLVLIDARLPCMNGLEVYLAIKPILPRAAVIMITEYRCEVDDLVRRALVRGAHSCLCKPMGMDHVASVIEEIQHGT